MGDGMGGEVPKKSTEGSDSARARNQLLKDAYNPPDDNSQYDPTRTNDDYATTLFMLLGKAQPGDESDQKIDRLLIELGKSQRFGKVRSIINERSPEAFETLNNRYVQLLSNQQDAKQLLQLASEAVPGTALYGDLGKKVSELQESGDLSDVLAAAKEQDRKTTGDIQNRIYHRDARELLQLAREAAVPGTALSGVLDEKVSELQKSRDLPGVLTAASEQDRKAAGKIQNRIYQQEASEFLELAHKAILGAAPLSELGKKVSELQESGDLSGALTAAIEKDPNIAGVLAEKITDKIIQERTRSENDKTAYYLLSVLKQHGQ